jgi:pyridoxine kinase
MSRIVSVQDISCFGQCSTTIALPVLSAYGIETAILPSAILSTHTAECFKGFTCLDLTDEMPKIVKHWQKEKVTFDAIYTGYIGDARQFELIKSLRTMLNPGGLVIVDPAMADDGVLYPALNEDIVEGMRGMVKEADIILPNLTEAAFLLDEKYNESYTEKDIEGIIKRLAAMGPKTVILTGVSYEAGRIGAVAYDAVKDSFMQYFTEKMVKSYHGTGDIFSSVAIANILNGNTTQETIADACEFVVKAIKNTMTDEKHNYGVKFETVLSERISSAKNCQN